MLIFFLLLGNPNWLYFHEVRDCDDSRHTIFGAESVTEFGCVWLLWEIEVTNPAGKFLCCWQSALVLKLMKNRGDSQLFFLLLSLPRCLKMDHFLPWRSDQKFLLSSLLRTAPAAHPPPLNSYGALITVHSERRTGCQSMLNPILVLQIGIYASFSMRILCFPQKEANFSAVIWQFW